MKDFTLVALLKLMAKRWWIILLTSIIVATLTFGYFSFFVPPTYMSNAIIIASNGAIIDSDLNSQESIKSSDLASSFALIPTYVGILKTDEPFNRVAATSGCGYTADQLKNKISISVRSENELFIDISVVDSDPEKARIIADSFIDVGAKYIVEKLPGAYASPLQLARKGYKNYPQPITYGIYGFVLAAAITVLILIVISMFDRSIKNEDDFKSSYKYPVLGVVPDYADAAKGDK